MEDAKPQFQSGESRSYVHEGPDESLRMNKYYLTRVIDRLQKRRTPHLEWVAVPFAIFLTLLLALLPGNFQTDYAGISQYTWEAVALIATVVTGIGAGILFVWWAYHAWHHPGKNPEEIVDEIIDEMTRDNERLQRLRDSQRESPSQEV